MDDNVNNTNATAVKDNLELFKQALNDAMFNKEQDIEETEESVEEWEDSIPIVAEIEEEAVEVVEDAYSPRRKVEPEREKLELPLLLEQKQTAIPVRQSIRQNARDIADVTYLPDFAALHRGENLQAEKRSCPWG